MTQHQSYLLLAWENNKYIELQQFYNSYLIEMWCVKWLYRTKISEMQSKLFDSDGTSNLDLTYLYDLENSFSVWDNRIIF